MGFVQHWLYLMPLQIFVVCSVSFPELISWIRLVSKLYNADSIPHCFVIATLFGQLWRLEPLPSEKKVMWRREMDWLLCVSDHIVELTPTWQTFPDGSKLEVRNDFEQALHGFCFLKIKFLPVELSVSLISPFI